MVRARKLFSVVGVVALALAVFVGGAGSPADGAVTSGKIYVSSSSSGTVDGIAFTGGDILLYDTGADTWSMFFDASDVLPASANIDGFHLVSNDPGAAEIQMGFTGIVNVPGLGSVDDSDLVTFTGTAGSTTAGTFAWLIDGSDVGLTSGGEDIDAVSAVGSDLAISTLGNGSVPRTGGGNLSIADENLSTFTGITGNPTSGTFATLLDTSDVGYSGDLVSAWVDPDSDEIFGSALNSYNIGGLTGDGDDIIVFTGTTGDPSSGTFDLFWDGDLHRFGGEQIDGLFIEHGAPAPSGEADLSISISSDVSAAVAGDTVTYTVQVDNAGPDTALNVVVTDTLPSGVSFGSTSGCVLDPNGLPCSLGDIASGATALFTIAVTVDGNVLGPIDNTVVATSGSADPNPNNNTDSAQFLAAGPPTAVDDGPSSSSTPGSPFHTDTDTPYTLAAPGLLANDDLGFPLATLEAFGGGDVGGGVDNDAQDVVSLPGGGSLTVNEDGSLDFTPPTGFAGPFTFDYLLSNEGGSSQASVTIYVGPRPVVMGGDLIYLSTAGSGTVDDIVFDDEDILLYNRSTDTWSMHIDGSDIGLGTADIDGFAIEDDGSILLSLTAPRSIPGAGATDDSDIVRFTPTSTGVNTAGTFAFHIDGSDLLLTAGGEDIDAITEYGEGDLAISTLGSFNMGGGVAGLDEDLIALGLTGTGPVTNGNPSILFDGSDVGLQPEDIFGASIDPETDVFYLANFGVFNIPNLSGDGDDVIAFSGTTGTNTSGSFSTFFAGEDARFDNHQIDGVHIALGSAPANTAPQIDPSTTTASVPENQTAATDVETTDDLDDETGGLTYSLLPGEDAALLSIDPATGIVTFNVAPDHENPQDNGGDNTYVATVRVEDSGGLSDEATITITVTNVVEDATVGNYIWDDHNGNGVQELDEPGIRNVLVRLMSGSNVLSSQTSNASGIYRFDVAPGTYDIVLSALPAGASLTTQGAGIDGTIDSDFDPATLTATVTLADGEVNNDVDAGVVLNQAPTIITPGPFSVPENELGSIDIEANDDSDSEANNGLTYSIGGDDGFLFDIDAATGVISFKDVPDYENPADEGEQNDYDIRVTVTDSHGLPSSLDMVVNVTNVVEQATLGDFLWNDVNKDGLQTAGEPGIQGVDAVLTDPITFTEVARDTTDENGSYSFTIDPGNYTLGFESLPPGAGFTFSEVGSDRTIDSNFNPTFPFVDVTLADDEVNNTVDAGLQLFNTAPSLPDSGPFSAPENQTEVVDLNATDDNDSEANNTLVYSFSGGADDGLFSIDPSTGVIAFLAPPDYENPGGVGNDNRYLISVQITDSEGGSSAYGLEIFVSNVVEQGTIGDFVWNDINQNGLQDDGEPGIQGVDVLALDPGDSSELGRDTTDSSGAWSLTLDPGTYLIVPQLPTGAAFTVNDEGNDDNIDSDFDPNTPSFSKLLLDDEVDNTIDAGIVLNQAPSLIEPGPTSVPERQTAAVTMTATDDGPVGDLTFSIEVNAVDDGALMSIDPQSGVVTFNDPPDYENPIDSNTNNGYTFVVRVTDAFGLFDEEAVTVIVTDVDEDPVITTPNTSVDENSTIAVDVDATDDIDSEANGTLTYSLGANTGDDHLMNIDPATGVVSFITPPDYENPTDSNTNNAYTFLVRVDDSEGHFDEQVFTITVNNVVEDGSISNYVWTDTNEDGLQDTNELGRDGVTVNLIDPDEDAVISSDTTSGGGLYNFTVSPGTYIVEFVAPANAVFTAQGAGTDPALDSDADEGSGRTATITISDDEDNDTIDAGLVTEPVWARQFTQPASFTGSSSQAQGAAIDEMGNSYVIGDFNGTVDFDPGSATANLTSAGSGDVFVAKLDAGGNLVWARRMGGSGPDSGRAIAVDAAGNTYLTGYFRGTADFDPDPATSFSITSTSNAFDVFVVRLDPNGDLIWAKNVGGTSDDQGYGIEADGVGNVYIAGGFTDTADFDPDPATSFNLTSNGHWDAFITKLDLNGDFEWAQQIGSAGYDIATGLAIDAAGDILTSGSFDGSADFDPDPTDTEILNTTGAYDAFVTKRTASGDLVWAKRFGGPNHDVAQAITVDPAGTSFVTGGFEGIADFDPDPSATFNLTSNGASDVFVAKLDGNGNLAWARGLGGASHNDTGRAIAVDSAGTSVVAGEFRGTADFDPDANNTYHLTGVDPSLPDAFIAKLDVNGNLVTAKHLVGTGYYGARGVGIDSTGRSYVAGYFQNTADFGPNPTEVGLLTAAGFYDTYVLRLALHALGNQAPTIATGSLEVVEGNTFVDDLIGDDDNDSEGSGLTFAIDGGTDSALFDIDAATGALSFLAAPDFENPGDADTGNDYEVTVSLTDSGGRGTIEALTVTVLDDPGDNFPPVVGTNDDYDSLGNVGIDVDAANGVLANDTGGAPALTVTEVAGVAGNVGSSTATSQGGSVTVNSDGSFTYTPAPGFEGADTFTYTVGDAAAGSDTATATITVDEVIWFIDDSASAGGDGTLGAPFDATFDLGPATDEANDIIFLASGNYTHLVLMATGQQLIGDGSTVDIPTATGITVPTFSKTLPIPVGTVAARPLISVTSSVALVTGADSTARGLALAGDSSPVLVGNNGGFSGTELSITAREGASGISFSFSASVTGDVSITNSLLSTTPSVLFNGSAVQLTTSGSASMDVVFTGNSVTVGSTQPLSAISINASGSSSVTADISNNPQLQGRGRPAVNIQSRIGADVDVVINNNSDIRTFATTSFPVALVADGDASLTVEVKGNTINPFSGAGLEASANISNGNADLDVTVENNTINLGSTSLEGIRLRTRSDATFCANVVNNSVLTGGAANDYALAVSESGTNDIVLQGLTSTVTGNVGTFAVGVLDQVWDDNGNTETTNEEGYLTALTGSAIPQAVPGTCETPTIP